MKQLIPALAMLALAACGAGGIRDSDPHLTGPRDMNYDHLIVPGQRVGPAWLSGSVRQTLSHLGNPDRGSRSTFRGPGYDADEVYYYYDDECISFTWQDKGVDPLIENGWRGINVTCDKWQTASGVRVGMSVQDVIGRIGNYCTATDPDGSLTVVEQAGTFYRAKNRNSPIYMISVIPAMADFGATGCNS